MQRMTGTILAAAAAVAAGFGAAATAQTVEGPEVSWRVGTWGKPRAFTAGIEAVKDYVAEKTGGNFTLTIGYESFGGPKELLDLVKANALEMTTICSSYHPDKAPTLSGLDLSFLPLPNADVQQAVHEAYFDHPAVVKDLAGWNAMSYMSNLLPQYEFIGRGEPPMTIEAWDGMRVRAIGGIGEAMKLLGAVPTSVDATEVYTSLDRGTVDAASFPSTYAHGSYRTYEVGDWFTTNMSPGTQDCPTLINIQAWEALPEQYQQLLLEAEPIAYEALKAAYQKADDEFIPLFKEEGLEFITYNEEELERFRENAARPVWEAWVKERDAEGVPGQELLDLILNSAKEATQKS